MKLPDAILLSLSMGFLLIGLHQFAYYSLLPPPPNVSAVSVGFGQSYPFFMLVTVLIMIFRYRRTRTPQTPPVSSDQGSKNSPAAAKNKGKQKRK